MRKRNFLLNLFISALALFGLNGMINKTIKASNVNEISKSNNFYKQKINQLNIRPKIQNDTIRQPALAYSTQSRNNFKNDITQQTNHLQNRIIKNSVKHHDSTPHNKYLYAAVHAYWQHHSNDQKYFYVSEAKNLTFQSQNNTDACEMASIKSVLSIHHKATHISLDTMLNRLGWNGNWNRYYTGNPYTRHGVTISPWLEARILRQYGVKAHVHKYMTKKRMISDLKHGYQFVIEAGHRCSSYRINYPHKISDHILAIVGIKYNQKGLFVQYVDSDESSKQSGVKWCPFDRLWSSYNRPKITGDRLVVAGY